MPAKRIIIHPSDFSKQSLHAFELAVSLARDRDCRLIVMHVAVPPVMVFGDGMLPPMPAPDLGSLRERLKHLRIRDPRVQFEHVMVQGDPATEILAAAHETGADFIVMGTHGRRGLMRALMGSVAEQVVRRAPCPVVTVNNPRQKSLRSPKRAMATAAAAGGESRDPEC